MEDQRTAAIQATFAGAASGDGTLVAADIRGAVVICSDEGVITYSNQVGSIHRSSTPDISFTLELNLASRE